MVLNKFYHIMKMVTQSKKFNNLIFIAKILTSCANG